MNPTHEHHDTDRDDAPDRTDATGTPDRTDATDTPATATDGTGREERNASAGRTPGTPKSPARRGAQETAESPAARRPAGWSRPEDGEEQAGARKTAGGTSSAEEGPGTPERPAAAPRPARDERVPAPGTPARPDGTGDKLRQRLQHAVGGFVDEPRHAVEEADEVLGEATERLIGELRGRREELRTGWRADGHDGGDTEKLRVALQGYRDLVDRVLHV
ncbi:hypothetical protein ACFZAU_01220 [Streptomyces sp. NPDC008238]